MCQKNIVSLAYSALLTQGSRRTVRSAQYPQSSLFQLLGYVPRVSAQLLVVRLQALDDPGNSEFKIALGAVERPYDQVHDAQVVYRPLIRECQPLFLLLDLAHEFFGRLILAGHDVRHTKVGQHNGRHVQQLLPAILVHYRIVVPDRLLPLGFLVLG